MSRIEPYISGLYRYALAMCKNSTWAEDLTQETLLRALRAEQPDSEASLKAWLFTILTNLWRDECRSAGHRLRQPGPPEPEPAADDRSPQQQLIDQERMATVRTRMNQLPQRQRQVLYMRVVEELSIDDIAFVLELNRNAVKSSLSAARKKMRTYSEVDSPAPS